MQIGQRLGPYEIQAPLGAGGMGEVWRARDTRLDRSVAIKLLPADLARSDAFRLRFEREAKTISQLNDPRICAVYDVGQHDGHSYIVMELVEGVSLADRIARGPLPLDEVLRYGIDIARALERAHAAGIVHRDLKPGNVMVAKSGAKLLDFGLAKPQGSGLGAQGSVAATQQKPITEQGTIIGTFQYMAPEQLEGEEADARTDIFAFGTLLYEMATGKKAFEGKTRTSLIAAIVDREPPPISSVRPLTPPAFDRVVATCMKKDPADRWQSAHDLRMELEWLANTQWSAADSAAPSKAKWLPWLIAAALAIALIVLVTRREKPVETKPIRTAILPPENMVFDFFLDAGPAEISPDGTKIVFLAAPPGETRSLFVRALGDKQPRKLSGTDNASHPFWSPDSRSVAFWADGSLMRIDTTGGAPVAICATSDVIRGGDWSADGTIIFGQTTDGIAMVSASGGTPVAVTELNYVDGETTHRWPSFLPDGKHFLYLSSTTFDGDGAVMVGSTEGKVRKTVLQVASNAVFHEGWVLYVRDRILTAQRFDLGELKVTGEPVPFDEGPIQFDSTTNRSFFSMSDDGTLLHQTGDGLRDTIMTFFDRRGNRMRATGSAVRYGSVALSPDGRTIAHSVVPRRDLWLLDTVRGVRTRLTFSVGRDFAPVWSPDGTKIVFSSIRPPGGGHDLYLKDLRTGEERALLVDEEQKVAASWSADGDKIFYSRRKLNALKDETEYYSFSDGKAHPLIGGPFNEAAPQISPDGKWVLYVSTETRPIHVYLSPFPPTGAKWQVSSVGGASPKWRADGKEVFYFTGGQIVAVPVNLTTPPEIGAAEPLFSIPFGIARRWDAAPDGKVFVAAVHDAEKKPPAPLTLVQGFGGQLRTGTKN